MVEDDPTTWLTLEEIQKQIDPGKWSHSRIYEDIEVAVACGHAHDFWDLPENTQAYIIARFRARGLREAFDDKIHKDELKAKERKSANKPGGRRR